MAELLIFKNFIILPMIFKLCFTARALLTNYFNLS